MSTTTTNYKKSRAKKAFKSAKSTAEMTRALKVLQTCSDENELGDEYMTLARKIFAADGGDQEQVLYYGQKALNIFLQNDSAKPLPYFCTLHARCNPLFITLILQLLGSACLNLNRFNESLSYLNWSLRNLNDLDDHETCPYNCVLLQLHGSHLGLHAVMVSMGRREEAASHMHKVLEIMEKYMDEGCLEIGKACNDVCEAYLPIKRFTDALPFCLRASEIYSNHFGDDSVEVAQIRRNLGVIYGSIHEYDKALEQHQLAIQVLERSVGDNSSVFWQVKIDSGHTLMYLGRKDEAVDVLKSVISSDGVDERRRATAYVTLASMFCDLKNFADAHKYVKLGRKILEKKGADPNSVACELGDVVTIYEMMKDYENAITVTRKLLALPKLPQHIMLEASDRLFELINLSGKVRQGLPYMEDVVEKLKDKFGPEHCVVGDAHLKLAVALMESGRRESSVKHFIIAKDNLDINLESPQTGQHFSCTYALMGRYRQAVEYQRKVVEGPEGLGQSEEDILKEAIKLLNEMELRDTRTDPILKSN